MASSSLFNSTKLFTALKPLLDNPYTSNVYDCCALLVICPKHNKFALCNTLHTGQHFRWFPWIHMSPQMEWDKVWRTALAAILGSPTLKPEMVANSSCLNVYRIQKPRIPHNFVTRILYYVELNPTKVDLCRQQPKVSQVYVEWFSVEAALKGKINDLWGPEVPYFLSMHKTKRVDEILLEKSSDECKFIEFPDDPILDDRLNSYKLERLYEDFIEHCFPSGAMCYTSFRTYLSKHDIETEEWRLKAYWNAFRFRGMEVVSFEELAKGIFMMDYATPHSIKTNSYRCKFIFRFYDLNRSDRLELPEFRLMIQDICTAQRQTISQQELDAKLLDILNKIHKRFYKSTKKDLKQYNSLQMNISTFLKAITRKILAHTSLLCRSRNTQVSRSIEYAIRMRHLEGIYKMQAFGKVMRTFSSSDKCPECVARINKMPYTVTPSVVFLKDNRALAKVGLLNISEKSQKSSSTNSSEAQKDQLAAEVQFNSDFLPNKYIQIIRDFRHTALKGKVKVRKVVPGLWPKLTPQERAICRVELETICKQVQALAMQEEHIVSVSSSAYLIGDIHGNLEDLISIEQALWPSLPYLTGPSYLFLGDYVDRGVWSLECVIYLFAFKLIAPHKVTLLRGNHEDRDLQVNYSFQKEMLRKFGKKDGMELWEIINKVFDCLPFAAIVDNSIFCVHGGIPYVDMNLPIKTAAEKHPKDIANINVAPLFVDLLWSDPVNNKQFREASEINVGQANFMANYELGYQHNYRRWASYIFNEAAFLRWCIVNDNITHLIRAHEVPREGYRLDFGTKCITIFSCSHYCGYENDCAVLLADGNRLRPIQVHTLLNNEATLTRPY